MKKDLGIVPAVYPMPVLMVAAYDENGRVNVMNAAWGMICDMDKIALFISEGHKTTQNILVSKAFTVGIADRDHMDVADYFGIATGNKTPDKFERTGYHAVRSSRVNAPVIDEFPVAMECELAEVASMNSLNRRLMTGGPDIRTTPPTIGGEILEQMLALMSRYLPEIETTKDVYIDGEKVSAATSSADSINMAMKQRRIRK
jgi:hypothetical protein